jgi:GxxExxY protein
LYGGNEILATDFTNGRINERDDQVAMKHGEITSQIIGAAFKVHAYFGFGFTEKVYENALAIELRKIGLKVEQQKPLTVRYHDAVVGEYVCDLLVEDKVLVEVKSVSRLAEAHHAQIVCYLRATRVEVGLLLNFGHSVEHKRKILDR